VPPDQRFAGLITNGLGRETVSKMTPGLENFPRAGKICLEAFGASFGREVVETTISTTRVERQKCITGRRRGR